MEFPLLIATGAIAVAGLVWWFFLREDDKWNADEVKLEPINYFEFSKSGNSSSSVSRKSASMFSSAL